MVAVPPVSKGLSIASDTARILGRGTRAAQPVDDSMGGGGPPVTPKVERTPIATDYKVDMKLGPKGSYEPKVMSLAAEAVVKAPGFEFNKAYPIEEMINKMSKYHNPTKGKGPANPKVQRQFETFVSPEFKAKGKATPKELQEEIQKNQMRFQENHTQFDMNERPRVVVDSGRPEGIPDENQYPRLLEDLKTVHLLVLVKNNSQVLEQAVLTPTVQKTLLNTANLIFKFSVLSMVMKGYLTMSITNFTPESDKVLYVNY